MTWIGIRDQQNGVFNEAGLGGVPSGRIDLNGFIPRGTLLMEFAFVPGPTGQQVPVLHHSTAHPWVSELNVWVRPNGYLVFEQRQCDRVFRIEMDAGLTERCRNITLVYTWDAPSRHAALTLERRENSPPLCVSQADPLPLSMRDAVRLSGTTEPSPLSPDVSYLALADHILPHGPLPSITPQTPVATPDGWRAIGDLRRGDLVQAADGRTAQVRWAGTLSLPARGRFAPVTLRAPFFGASRDLTVARQQRIVLSGSEVDYLFSAEQVSVRVGDLPAHAIKAAKLRAFTQTFCQVLLDRQVPVRVGGVAVQTLDAASMAKIRDQTIAPTLCDIPAELLPARSSKTIAALTAFEAMTLCNLLAA